MWKIIQQFEKDRFLREYMNGQYSDDNIVIVDMSGKKNIVVKTDEISVKDFALNDVLITVYEPEEKL